MPIPQLDLWGISRLHRFFAYLSVLATWSSADTVAQMGIKSSKST